MVVIKTVTGDLFKYRQYFYNKSSDKIAVSMIKKCINQRKPLIVEKLDDNSTIFLNPESILVYWSETDDGEDIFQGKLT